jgi:4-amino-4-deoxy-L-arabinose transferase-like glycosyltransferase
LLISFVAVVPLWAEPELILDASRYFLQAKYLEIHGISSFLREWGREINAWTDLPAVPFLYGVIFRYLGETRFAVQMATTLLFSLTVLLTYRIGKILWDREAGFLAAVLLPAMPYLLVQTPLMLVDVPAMFLVTLSIDSFLHAVRRGGAARILLSSCALVLALFAKYSTWPMLLVLPVIAAVSARQDRAAAGRALAVIIPAAVASLLIILSRYDVFSAQMALLREYQWPGLGRWKEGFVSTFFFQVHPFVSLLALWGVLVAVRKRDAWFLVPGWFAVFMLGLRVERIRYMLPLFPLLALMAGYGLRAFGEQRVRRFAAYAAAAASLAIAFTAYLPFLNGTSMANLRDAGKYLDGLPGAIVEVRTAPQRDSAGNTEAAIPLLDLFTRKRIVSRQEPAVPPDSARLAQSSLRFSWEPGAKAFYARAADEETMPVAVISAGDMPPPPGRPLTLLAAFALDTGTFRYRTAVAVYDRGVPLAENAH